ncbi:MAG: hypothetical protein ACYDBB_01095 [Armatimonadota bacterium]
MTKYLIGMMLLCGLLLTGFTGIARANSAVDGDAPAIMVSPSVIVLAKVDTITVHSNIVATAVEPGSVTLNGVAPTSIGTDNLGHLVVKFALADLELSPGEVLMTLIGAFTDGNSFSATDVVTVK